MKFRIVEAIDIPSREIVYQVEIRRWWFPFWVRNCRWRTKEEAANAIMTMKESLLRS